MLAFDIADDGSLSDRRTFVALDDLVGADPERSWEVGPDGLNVDRDGNLMIAEYGAGRLLVVDKDGRLVATIQCRNATSPHRPSTPSRRACSSPRRRR